MAVAVRALLRHFLLDKEPDQVIYGLDPDLKWVAWKAVRHKVRIIEVVGESLEQMAASMKDLRDTCPFKPYYLDENSPSVARVLAHWIEPHGEGYKATLSFYVESHPVDSLPRLEDQPYPQHIDQVLLESFHEMLANPPEKPDYIEE